MNIANLTFAELRITRTKSGNENRHGNKHEKKNKQENYRSDIREIEKDETERRVNEGQEAEEKQKPTDGTRRKSKPRGSVIEKRKYSKTSIDTAIIAHSGPVQLPNATMNIESQPKHAQENTDEPTYTSFGTHSEPDIDMNGNSERVDGLEKDLDTETATISNNPVKQQVKRHRELPEWAIRAADNEIITVKREAKHEVEGQRNVEQSEFQQMSTMDAVNGNGNGNGHDLKPDQNEHQTSSITR